MNIKYKLQYLADQRGRASLSQSNSTGVKYEAKSSHRQLLAGIAAPNMQTQLLLALKSSPSGAAAGRHN